MRKHIGTYRTKVQDGQTHRDSSKLKYRMGKHADTAELKYRRGKYTGKAAQSTECENIQKQQNKIQKGKILTGTAESKYRTEKTHKHSTTMYRIGKTQRYSKTKYRMGKHTGTAEAKYREWKTHRYSRS